MTVAMFKPYSLFYSIIKIFCSYNSKDWHHKLCCDQRMFLRSFEDDAADICRCVYSDHGKKCSCITTYTFTIQFTACQNNFCKFVLLFLRSKIAATEMRWRKDANNKWEQYPVYAVNDRNPYGHGEKSVMMASEFIHLTMEERYAIRWHMGMSEANIIQTYCQAAEKYPLVLFTHMADQMATSYLETNTGNKKPEDIYLGTEPAAQDPEEFAEAEPI